MHNLLLEQLTETLPIYVIIVGYKVRYIGLCENQATSELVRGIVENRTMEIWLRGECISTKHYSLEEINQIKKERYA